MFIFKNKVNMYNQNNYKKKVPRVLSSSESDTDDLQKKVKKKKILPLISSDECDTAIKDDNLHEQNSFTYFNSFSKVAQESDNSSVESLDIIMYPSASVLSQIENSKKSNINAEFKDHKKNLIGWNQKCSVKEITKSTASLKQAKVEKIINNSSKELPKKDEISNPYQCKKKVHNNKLVQTSKVKNHNASFIHRVNSTNIHDNKISNDHELKKEFQNNKIDITKVKNINISPSINNENASKSIISNQDKPKREIQKSKVIVTDVENKVSNNLHSKNVHKVKISNQHQPKKEIQKHNVIVPHVKNKNSIISNINNKTLPKGKISNQHHPKTEHHSEELKNNKVIKTTVINKNDKIVQHSMKLKNATGQNYQPSNKKSYKIPILHFSKSDKNEKLMPNKCDENDKITYSGFEKNESEFQIKESTVKRRPENYGSRLEPLISDLKSSVENKSLHSKHKKLTKIKHINQLKVKDNELEKRSDENEVCDQIATDHLGFSNKRVNCTIQQDSKVKKIEQSSAESQLCNSLDFIDSISRNSVSKYRSLIDNDYQHKLIKRIVDINVKWLEGGEQNSRPPPDLLKAAEKLPLSFKSFDEYFCKHEPMVILEIWEKIFERNKINLSPTTKNYFNFLAKDYKYINGLILLDCESEVNEHRPCVLAKNNLVIVKLKHKNVWSTTFGFINELESTKNIDYFKEKEYPSAHYLRKTPAKQFFKMFIKSLEMVDLKYFSDGKVICNLNKEMKEIEGLYLMKSSPLLYDILNPCWDTFYTPYNQELCMKDFDTVRLHISDIVCNEINSFPSKSKIMLVQGPPGSCKTMCIAYIAWRLSKCKDNKKILIVVPNRKVLEVIITELLNLNDLFKDDIKFWSLGIAEITPFYGKILKDTSVILTRPKDICELEQFKKYLQFSCCLIDEINQFTEPGILYPFSLDIHKFLLVGDPKQLPAKIRSNITEGFGYKKSIMERFQAIITKTYDKNPTIVLKQQFRMHHQISLFPFKTFYSDVSIKSILASKRSALHPLRHYVLFDYQCDNGSEKSHPTELMGRKFIATLLSHIIPKLDSSAIGIIVPSKEEQLTTVIKDFPNVEVGTVETFQGREKPVIIISCFHDFQNKIPFNTNYFSDKRRLNVALTRAISSLIICGPFQTLMKYDIWAAVVSYSLKHGYYFKIRCDKDLQYSKL